MVDEHPIPGVRTLRLDAKHLREAFGSLGLSDRRARHRLTHGVTGCLEP